MNPKTSPRFDLLDGLRGGAAVAVMLYHYTLHNGLHWLSGAWVAVDLFFVLSGFVIAHSYGGKILDGMTFRQFAAVRLIRLGPLYLVALAMGVLALAWPSPHGAAGSASPTQIGAAAVLGLFWLPYFNDASWSFGAEWIRGPVFPLNDPAWSLFFELFVNVVFFHFVRTTRRVSSRAVVGLSFCVFAACTLWLRQSNPGWGSDNFVFGFARVTMGFFAGALIYTMGWHLRPAHAVATALVAAAVLLLALSGNTRIAVLNSVTLVPLTVVLMSACSVHWRARAACKVLGDLSYPLYVIHFPVYRLAYGWFGLERFGAVSQTLLLSVIAIALALLLAPADLRLRQRLGALLRPAQPTGNPV